MAITNFIPTIWSETLYEALDKQYIAAMHCNRDFEGDIKGKGSSVKICGVGAVNVSDYTRNTDLSAPQTLSDTAQVLSIDQAKCFNFQIDDIDRVQSTPKLMQAAMKNAASALANEADRYIYSLVDGVENSITEDTVTPENIIDAFIEARKRLYLQNVVNPADIVYEIHPKIAAVLLKAKIQLSTDNGEALDNGCIGSVLGSRVYVTGNLTTDETSDTIRYNCVARTKRAVAFAEQLSEIDAYRPEKRFADAVKGLHLYGAKVVYENEIVRLALGVGEQTA